MSSIYTGHMHTPFFPAWRAQLAPRGLRFAPSLKTVRSYTLSQLEERFGPSLPAHLFPKAPSHQNSRDRIYTQPRTFWSFLYQGLNPQTACREVVRQIQALFELHNGPAVSSEDGAYCRARQRLPQAALEQALVGSAQAAARPLAPTAWLQGRRVKVVDGTTVSLPDTAANQKAYPQLDTLAPGCGFPLLRLVVLFSLLSGAILAVMPGSWGTAELRLFYELLPCLQPQDILLADRGFGSFWVLAWLRQNRIDFIGRCKRPIDGRRVQRRLGRNDWLVTWNKPAHPSVILPAAPWAGLPDQLTVRIVRGSLYRKGFRVRQITVVTTLLEVELYPAQEILQAYLRRWRLELCLDDLKTTLHMSRLRCLSPAMVKKEVYVHFIVHNLIRLTMAQAAAQHQAPVERLSFKGTLDALRQFNQAISQARTQKKRRDLWEQLLRILVLDQVPERPGRREPRALKRQFNKYPRLNLPRHRFKDPSKRNVRLALANRRRKHASVK
jgi:hypothetical protein